MKSPLRRILVLFAVCAACLLPQVRTASAELPGLPRERGAIYLTDFFEQPYRLRVQQETAIYYNADLARLLGTLRSGQLVELQAVDDKRGLVRVRGQARQGQVAGWTEARFLSPLDPEFVAGLRRSVQRREQVAALTANGEIALGMTMQEVAGTLGQPIKKESHTDAAGVVETWQYTRYVVVPRTVTSYDQFGRIYTGLVYQKVPAGSFSASFSDGVVSAIDRSQVRVTNPNVLVPTRSVTAPIVPTTPTQFAERNVSG